MSHTPGPWKVTTDKRQTVKKRGEEPWDFQVFEIVGEGKFRVATADFWSIGNDISKCGYPRAATPELAEANAHLIAAAPLLLEAAEAALKLFDEYAIEDEHPQKIAALRTAINAAKGNR